MYIQCIRLCISDQNWWDVWRWWLPPRSHHFRSDRPPTRRNLPSLENLAFRVSILRSVCFNIKKTHLAIFVTESPFYQDDLDNIAVFQNYNYWLLFVVKAKLTKDIKLLRRSSCLLYDRGKDNKWVLSSLQWSSTIFWDFYSDLWLSPFHPRAQFLRFSLGPRKPVLQVLFQVTTLHFTSHQIVVHTI